MTQTINQAVANVKRTIESSLRQAITETFIEIIENTPVGKPDTWQNKDRLIKAKKLGRKKYVPGRLRSSWQASLDAPDLSVKPEARPSRAKSRAISHVKKIMRGWKPGRKVCFSNAMPYAYRIEMGYSRQAPAGMVRVSMRRFNQKLAAIVQSRVQTPT